MLYDDAKLLTKVAFWIYEHDTVLSVAPSALLGASAMFDLALPSRISD